MPDRFFLYIDILGFSELVESKPEILPDLFHMLDESNVHKDSAASVIQFSDTLIAHFEPIANSDDAKNSQVMYLCEFAKELQYKLLGHNVFLRGFITCGQFEDTGSPPNRDYQNIRAFWGKALINAYHAEKSIQAIGLFIDETVKPHMNVFETHLYDTQRKIWFTDTLQMIQQLLLWGDGVHPAGFRDHIPDQGLERLMVYDLLYLRRLFEYGHDERRPPLVRTKHLTTWAIYRQKYPRFCHALEEAEFDFQKVIDLDWKPFIEQIGTPDGYFG